MQVDLPNSNFCRKYNFFQRGERVSPCESCSIQDKYDIMLIFYILIYISLVFNPNSRQQNRQNQRKKHNHKIDTIFILGNPQGEENPTKIHLQMYNIKPQKHVFSSLLVCISLSLMFYTSVCLCVKMMSIDPLFIHFKSLDFYPNKLAPLN